jgi:hypothetical protein
MHLIFKNTGLYATLIIVSNSQDVVDQVWYLNQLHTHTRSRDTTPNATPCFVHVICSSNIGRWMKADIVEIG